MEILTIHASDRGVQENIHNLTAAELKVREIERIDIAAETPIKDPKTGEIRDPKAFKSAKTDRGDKRVEC